MPATSGSTPPTPNSVTWPPSVRARFHPADRATYMVMRIINYTNVCVAQCDYCAFYKLPGQDGGYVLSQRSGFREIRRAARPRRRSRRVQRRLQPASAARLLLRPLLRHSSPLRRHAGVLRAHHRRIPLPRRPRQADYAEAAARFKTSGVRWITGGGSEILTEDFRSRHSKFKYTVAEYFAAQRAIVEAGLKTTATMVIGFDESLDERIEHLERTRTFQDEVSVTRWRPAKLPLLDLQAVLHPSRRHRDHHAGVPPPPRALPHLPR